MGGWMGGWTSDVCCIPSRHPRAPGDNSPASNPATRDGVFSVYAGTTTVAASPQRYSGSNVEGDGDYRADKYYEGDGGLGYVYLPDASEYGAPEGRLGGDRHPPARLRGLPSFHGWSMGPITGRATLSVAGALPEAVPGMVTGLPITLTSLPAALSLRHSSVGAAAALVLSIAAEAVTVEDWGRAARGRRGSGRARRQGGIHHMPTGRQ